MFNFRKLDENASVVKEGDKGEDEHLSGVILPARDDETFLCRPSSEEFNQIVWIDRSSTPSEGTRHAKMNGDMVGKADDAEHEVESPPPSPSRAVDQIERLLKTTETWNESSEDEEIEGGTERKKREQENYVLLSKSTSREDLRDEGGSLYQRLSRTFSGEMDVARQESLPEQEEPPSSVESIKKTESKTEGRVQSPLVLRESDPYVQHYDKEFGQVI